MKIAILHEMLVKLGGAEKVVESMMRIFPKADLFTLIYDEKKTWKVFLKEKINPQVFNLTTQKIYNFTKKQRLCLPYMAKSIESIDFSAYDVVLCSSSWFAHWAITKPDTKFIVYSHSPARYMWDWTNEYKKDIGWSTGIKWYFLNKLFLGLRQWDVIASERADIILANSKNTASRIEKYYRRNSEIVYPPVEIERFWKKLNSELQYKKVFDNYYIIISALTEFKKIEITIAAFNKMPDKNLVIIWDWDHRENLENMIANKTSLKWKNIIFTWAKYDDELVYIVQNSSGLIFPGEEDFWIVPIEVMAAWKAVFAYKAGWLLETNIEWVTWEFFKNKDWLDFIENFIKFDKNNFDWKYKSIACIKQAKNFSEEAFEKKLKELIF